MVKPTLYILNKTKEKYFDISAATFYDVISSDVVASQPDILTGGHLPCRAGTAVTEERPQEELGLLVVIR